MKSWAKWTAKTVLVTTGFAAAGGGFAGVALAGTGGANGNVSVLGSNQVSAPVSVPINICGNAAALLGIAAAGCQGGAEVLDHHYPAGPPASGSHGPATKNISAGSDNSIQIPIKVAANACGNAIGGGTKASCQGGVYLPGGDPQAGGRGSIRQAGLSAGNISVGSGNQVRVPVTVPANICGNAAAVLGNSNAGCVGGATVGGGHDLAAGNGRQLSSAQLASVGTLPGVANLPTLAGLTDLPVLSGLTSGGSLLPASSLSALSTNVDGGGMSSNSFATLAIGALLAGAAALKLAGRRSRTRKGATEEVRA
jgi:ChpA-C